MKTRSMFQVEFSRLLKCRMMPFVAILTILSPAAGLWFYKTLVSTSTSSYVTTVLGTYLANPALAGGFFGAAFFAVLTIMEFDRVERNHVDTILYSVISPLKAARVRILTLLVAAGLIQVIVMLVWLPVTMYKTGSVFDFENYIWMYILFMFAEIVTAILFATAAYQLTRRADLSIILYTVFTALGLTVFQENWLLSWAKPLVWAVSDDFTNHRILMSVAYMRAFWLLVLSGTCFFTYLCIRHYGKNVFSSFFYHMRRVPALLLAVALVMGSIYTYQKQPFLDHASSLIDYDAYYTYEVNENVICHSIFADIHPDTRSGSMHGTELCQIENTSGKEQTVSFYLKPGYQLQEVTANDKSVNYHINKDDAINTCTASITLPADKNIELQLKYGGFPRDWSISYSMQGDPEISSDYMCLENACLAPAPRDLQWGYEEDSYVVNITLPGNLQPVPFGSFDTKLLAEEEDGTRKWEVKTNNYYLILFVADYECEEFEAGGINVKFYYGKKHKEIMEEAKAVESISNVINYCTEHVGPLNFFGAQNSLKLVERRVTGGGYAANGASSLDEVDYTAKNLSNESKGSVPGEIVIHETVHQWWGLGNMFDNLPTDLWSSEGLTVYTTYRIVKELYGADYANENYVKQWKKRVKGYYENYYIRHPKYLESLPQKYQDSISNSLSEIRQYAEMPLKLLKAEELVGGEEKLDAILQKLFSREMTEENQYLTYQMFLDACGLSEEDLNLE